MRRLPLYITLLGFLLVASCSNGIEFEGMDVTKYEVPDENWRQPKPGLYYKKLRSRYFTEVYLSVNEKNYTFMNSRPEAVDFEPILTALRDKFGKEDTGGDTFSLDKSSNIDSLAQEAYRGNASLAYTWDLSGGVELGLIWLFSGKQSSIVARFNAPDN